MFVQGVQSPSGRPGVDKAPRASAQSYFKLSRFGSGPHEWTDTERAQGHLCNGGATEGTILHASLPSGAGHVETLRGPGPSPLTRVSTGTGVSTQRLLRIRRRNIRFLCNSRKNRMRGLLPPAKETIEAAMEEHDSAEEALLLRRMRLNDPLVDEVPIRRWRTQWFPSFARRSLVPLVQAASRCHAIVEVRDARLPLLSRCNLRVLQLPKPKVVILTHADQASPIATRHWQRHFRRESREVAALELHAELTRARKLVRNSEACPLAPRLQHLFIDAREPAAVVRVQRLLRSLVKRHRRYRRELDAFRSVCKQAAAAAAADGVDASTASEQVAQLVASLKGATNEAADAGGELTKASLQQRKPLRILIVGLPNLHRQPVTMAGVGDMSRLFDVVDTPGFIPVHPGKGKGKRKLNISQHKMLQQRLGTGARQGQLDLGLFFDYTHPRPSPDELALLGAFHMLPHSCLFTIEEAAVALGNAFFRIRKLLPAASDIGRVMTRYKMSTEAFKEDMDMGVQLLLTLAEKRHHSNEGAAAQRLLSDFTQGYLGRHTFELPPMRYPGEAPTTRTIRNPDTAEGNAHAADEAAGLSGHSVQAPSRVFPQGSSTSNVVVQPPRTRVKNVHVGLVLSKKRKHIPHPVQRTLALSTVKVPSKAASRTKQQEESSSSNYWLQGG
ncbi:GTP-binding conserved hypothetical domain-containing protein, putative [Eimeria praecox]|uniref:GTP-binding conserved hypothetical domain-containing protein, putative n=1 Tax=Eimeria praecox TaxID=51316 RepID=U6G7T8_9EIME|nr:GTP-binding conserved hypothetical domain-containing protein, putative [Eimeria praecox]